MRNLLRTALSQYKKLEGVSDVRLHDVRRSLRTFAASRKFGRDAAEAALAHKVVRNELEQVYNQYDYAADGRAVILAWQRHFQGLLNPQDNVVQITGAAVS